MAENGDDVVRVEVTERVATVTIDRPEVRNALNAAVLEQLPRVVRECEASDEVDVLVLTGADPAFSAGLDLKELGSGGGPMDVATRRWAAGLAADHKPLIGAVNGVAVTGGLELALACDFLHRVRAGPVRRHARPRRDHARWGLTAWLPEAVGVRLAADEPDRQLRGRRHRVGVGLVNEVVPHDELLPRCRRWRPTSSRTTRPACAACGRPTPRVRWSRAPTWPLESEVSRSWRRGGATSDEVERRRATIIQRGRSQQA